MGLILDDEKKKKEEEGVGALTPKTSQVAGGGQAITGQATKPAQTSGFVNLQKYLSASDEGRIGESIAGDIGKRKEQFKTQMGDIQEQEKAKIAPGITGYDPEALKNLGDEEVRAGLKSTLSAKPTEYTGFSTAGTEAESTGRDIGGILGSLEKPGTYSTALKGIGGPSYTGGMSALDTGLLAGSPEAKQQIEQARTGWETTSAELPKTISEGLAAQAQQAATATEKTQQDLRDALAGVYSGVEDPMQERIAAEEVRRAEALAANRLASQVIPEQIMAEAKAAAGGSTLSDAEAWGQMDWESLLGHKLGMTGLAGELGTGGYYNPTEVDYRDVTTAAEQEQMANIADILGEQFQYGGELGADPTDYLRSSGYETEYRPKVDAITAALADIFKASPTAGVPVSDPTQIATPGTLAVDPQVVDTGETGQVPVMPIETVGGDQIPGSAPFANIAEAVNPTQSTGLSKGGMSAIKAALRAAMNK